MCLYLTLIIVLKSSLHCLNLLRLFLMQLGMCSPRTWKIQYWWFQEGWDPHNTQWLQKPAVAWVHLTLGFFYASHMPSPLLQWILPQFSSSLCWQPNLHIVLKEVFSLLTLVQIWYFVRNETISACMVVGICLISCYGYTLVYWGI